MTVPEKAFDDVLAVRPPVGAEQLAKVPAKRGVALLEADRGEPIVLLTAADIRARLRTRLAEPLDDRRRRSADLRRITRRVRWKLAGGHFETDLRFLEIARSIWPRSYTSLLAWKRPWFVHVDPADEFPHFVRTRGPGAGGGLHLGPFASGRLAEKFIQTVQDAFDLCRDIRSLRLAPDGSPCPYAQMGRCPCPCDGTMPMAEYRMRVAHAAEAAAGRRGTVRHEWTCQMNKAAGELRFERAAAIKVRLAALAELDAASFRQVAPTDAFRFLMIQPGLTRRQANVFLVNGGSIIEKTPLAYPLRQHQLAARLAAMSRHAARPAPPEEEAARWRMGLVAGYLLAGEARRGVMLRWHEGLGPKDVAAAVENAKECLGLSEPKRAGKKAAASAKGDQ